jgi:hypothetical protein
MTHILSRPCNSTNNQRTRRRTSNVPLGRWLLTTLALSLSLPAASRAASQSPSMLLSLRECEAANNSCGAWVFQGQTGRGVWYDGAYADLKVDYLDNDTVIITRTDAGRSTTSIP